jgi:two-component system invasion response regulator UvrY
MPSVAGMARSKAEPRGRNLRNQNAERGTNKVMRILLVEDHKATRDEVCALIKRQPDMIVVAEAGTGEDALEWAREEKPDIVVMDIRLPGMNGIETTRKMLAEQPGIKVLALSNHFGVTLMEAILEAGALGYVRKSKAFEELIPALRSVDAGQPYVSMGSAGPGRGPAG